MRKTLIVVTAVVTLFSSFEFLHAWGGQGHRLVGLVAADRLTPIARQNVAWLARPNPCNLHSVWDGRLIARRNLDDRAYLDVLQKLIIEKRWGTAPAGTPAQWAEQSFRLAKDALVTPDTNIDEGYYRRHIGVIDERIALGGVRLAAVLNRVLTTARP